MKSINPSAGEKAGDPDKQDMPTRAIPVVELDEDQTEALFGRLPSEGDSANITLSVSEVMDSGNYKFDITRDSDSDEEDELSDEALGYPRSKLVKPKPAPPISAADLAY